MNTPIKPRSLNYLLNLAILPLGLVLIFADVVVPRVNAEGIVNWINTTAALWTTTTAWSPNGAPAAGNNYFVTNVTGICRSPDGSATFGGDSLTLTNGGILNLYRTASGGETATFTINNFTNAGGTVFCSRSLQQNLTYILGNPAVFLGSSQIQFGGSSGSGSYYLTLQGGISGSGTIVSYCYSTNLYRTLTLSGNNAGYSGNLLFTNVSDTYASAAQPYLMVAHSSGWGSGNLTFARTTGNGPEVVFGTIVNSPTSLMTLIGAQANVTANVTLGSLAGNTNAANTSPAVVISSGATLSVGADNTSTNFAGVISGAGNLTKIGSGIWTLSGANPLTGNTTVSAGTLALGPGGSIANSANIVLGGGTLDATVLSSFYLGSAQALILTGGTLLATNLTLDTTTLTNSTTSPSPVVTTTTLNYGGATTVAVSALPGFSRYPAQYSLVKYASIGTGSFNLSLASLPAGYGGYLSNNVLNSSIDVVLTNGLIPIRALAWTGAVSDGSTADWDVQNTLNWRNSGLGTFYNQGDYAIFNDTATGANATNVNLTTTLSPGTLSVSNNLLAYTFTGSGYLAGGITLVKQGTNSLTVNNTGANGFTGGILGAGGTVLLEDQDDAISGGVTATNGGLVIVDDEPGAITGNTLIYTNSSVQIGNNDFNGSLPSGVAVLNQGGTLVFNSQNNPETVANTISGAGSVVQNNASGMLAFSQANTAYSGTTIVNQGILQLNAINQAGTGPFALNPNGTLLVTFNTANALASAVPNVITGTGTVNFTLGNNATFLAGSMSGFTGTIECPPGSGAGGLVEINSSVVNLNPAASISISNGGTFYTTVAIPAHVYTAGTLRVDGGGIVSGPVTLQGNAAFTQTATGTISGSIGDGGNGYAITKQGAGTLVLSNANTYTGPTFVNAGTLVIVSAGSIATSTNIAIATGGALNVSAFSPWTLADGQILSGGASGGGSITGAVSTATGSIVAPGYPANTATLTVSSNLTLGGLTLLNLNNTPANDELISAGTLTYGGTLIVTNIGGSDPSSGTTFTLFQAGSLAGSFASVQLPAFSDPSLTWLNNLSINGTITVLPAGARALTWKGSVPNGYWDIATTSNWLYSAAASIYNDGDVVTFNDTATLSTVNLTNTLSPSVLTVTNSHLAYLFSGAGGLSGKVTLLKEGTNSLTLANTGINNFTGGVLVQGGSLVLLDTNDAIGGNLTVQNGGRVIVDDNPNSPMTGNLIIGPNSAVQIGNNDFNGALPAGSVTINGGGALVFDTLQSPSIATAISGAGALIQNGLGTLTLSAINSYTGGTIVNAGVLELSANSGGSGTIKGSLTVNPGAVVTATAVNALGYSSSYWVTNLNVYGSTFATTAGGDQGWGLTVNLMGGTLDSSASGSEFSMGGGWFNNTLATNVTSTILGTINTRSGNTNNEIPFNVAAGAASPDLLVSAVINNTTAGVGILKAGAGVLTLAGDNTYSGTTTVSNGTLLVNGSTASASLVTVAANATLGGSGTVLGAAIITSGGIIQGGDANYTNFLTVNTALNLGDTTNAVTYSKFRIVTGGTIEVGALNVNGTNFVNILDLSLALGTNTLFNYSTLGGTNGFAGFHLGALPAGVTANLQTNSAGTAVQLAVTAVSSVNTNPTNIIATASSGNLKLSWPLDHTGWRLLVQTNHLAAGVSENTNDWGTVAGSATTNQVSIPIISTNRNEFYRLVYP